MRRKNVNRSGIVYSTDPEFESSTEEEDQTESAAKNEQPVRIQLDRKQRAGKSVTLVHGFKETEPKLQDLTKELKRLCGTGGSMKNGEVLIQGDFRQKIQQWLIKQGYTKAKIV